MVFYCCCVSYVFLFLIFFRLILVTKNFCHSLQRHDGGLYGFALLRDWTSTLVFIFRNEGGRGLGVGGSIVVANELKWFCGEMNCPVCAQV